MAVTASNKAMVPGNANDVGVAVNAAVVVAAKAAKEIKAVAKVGPQAGAMAVLRQATELLECYFLPASAGCE